MISNFFKNKIKEAGSILVLEVVLIFVVSLTVLAVLGYASSQLRTLRQAVVREQALHVAEAGIDYYRWHLEHFPTDYTDGNGGVCDPCGPYQHDYTDPATGSVLGTYQITIEPPGAGSSKVTVSSVGYRVENPNVKRTIQATFGKPSLAKFAYLTNSDAWVSSGQTVNGAFHANGGIRFDGTGTATISSAKNSYTCTSSFGCNPSATKPGIWGSAGATTQSFWQFPVPNEDFAGIAPDLAELKSNAQLDGLYLPPSAALGYSLVFASDGTVTVYKVTSLRSHQTGFDVNGSAHIEDLDYNSRSLQFTQALPANGVIFVEDKTWVEGVLNGRVTVVAASLPYNPSTSPDIIVPNNLTYLAKDGSHALGLIAQRNFLISHYSADTLEVNAAIIAQKGSAQRYNFAGDLKTSLSIYGSLASFGTWAWNWLNGSGQVVSGYLTTSVAYDSNLLYSPPPSFPLTTDSYEQLSWESF